MTCLQYRSTFPNPLSQYLRVQTRPPITPWYSHFKDIRRALIVKLSRLRTGHNRLPPHMKRINLSETDLCPFHTNNPSIATLNHILFECKNLHKIRLNLYTSALNLKIPTPFSSDTLLSSENIKIFPEICKFISLIPDPLII